jgi:metallophosphoesterase (TIGR00282 family)
MGAGKESKLKVLFIGDIFGSPGRGSVREFLTSRREEGSSWDFVIANGENLAGGKGVTRDVAEEMFSCGVDVLTGGNHTWAKKEVLKFIDGEERLLRPANYPEGTPGRGSGIYVVNERFKVAVLNLMGRVFLQNYDCPFRYARRNLAQLREQTSIIIVDFHAEATSEKNAFGWFVDGEVSAVIGTHTHIQTADERILPGGTAYITDVGMTGPYDSVIGVKKEIIIEGFQNLLPVRHEVAKGDVHLCAVELEIDEMTGRAKSIGRIQSPLFDKKKP